MVLKEKLEGLTVLTVMAICGVMISKVNLNTFQLNVSYKDLMKKSFSIVNEEKNEVEPYKAPKEFLSLIRKAEGYSNVFYRDNVGFAIGYGWNITRNSKDLNLVIANYIQAPPEVYNAIEKYSGKKVYGVPKELESVVLTDAQIEKSAGIMFYVYEGEFLKTYNKKMNSKEEIEIKEKEYYSLPFEQRAVFSHMAYKLGSDNLRKFSKFFVKFNNYLLDKTDDLKVELSKELNYKYKVRTAYGNFVRKFDVKVGNLHKEVLLGMN